MTEHTLNRWLMSNLLPHETGVDAVLWTRPANSTCRLKPIAAECFIGAVSARGRDHVTTWQGEVRWF